MNAKACYLYQLSGVILALSAVILGAFGAHALKDTLVAKDSISVWETAVHYQMWHALALLLLSLFSEKKAFSKIAGQCFIFGTLLFSGSLYLLALGGPGWLGPVTPIGGLCLITGWALFFLSIYKNNCPLAKN
jgi:uncharacterized membrane protein YgdD (TMEM256/DUF423 family)